MSGTGPSVLSLFAAAGYGLVVAGCVWAAFMAKAAPIDRAHSKVWIVVAGFFLVLMVLRIFDIEHVMRDALRGWLRDTGAYEARRSFQLPLALFIGALGAGLSVWLVKKWRGAVGRRNRAQSIAILGSAGMVFLIAIRSVSFSAFDRVLYGPFKLNWIVDLGCASLVLAAALAYARIARNAIKRRAPSQ